ncbi:hypothetical protein J416_12949 [Gracilibacillus halophilus YIM-C55.5]|uniref:HD domain-containing protein n=1 Tax=Gracilibacillus halophilus YIM-C55.5 TaxID=1308866 RepID=N4WNI6_9BACI|nr:hypothetical protein [Gracilibacillus halophilus]ENH96035.1 hypothetical protein J416_12949 [Gracilibacillus halophilus YIM-C55.5]
MSQNHYFYGMVPVQYDLTEETKATIRQQFPPPTLPDATDIIDLTELGKGTAIETRVLLNDYQVRTTKTNKSFLKLNLSNQSGNIPAKMWDNHGMVATVQPLLDTHGVFDIKGTVDEFNGFKSVTVQEMTPCSQEIDPFTLLAYTKQDLDALTLELFAYLYELEEPYQSITLHAMEELWDAFRLSPAAKGFHHHYLGGLLKHTVGLMRICRYITVFEENPFRAVMKLIHKVETEYKQEIWESLKQDETYPRFVWKGTIDHLYQMLHGMAEYKYDNLHYDALMTSILFHDIGKLMEYDYAGKTLDIFQYLYPSAYFESTQRQQAGITMDPLGVFVGHIPYGVLLMNRIIEDKQIHVSMESIHVMNHCILCHHGLPEWGSAVQKPLHLEGYIIHIVDYLDSRYENTESNEEK